MNLYKMKENALNELNNIIYNSDDLNEWNDEKITTLYNFYSCNEKRTDLHKYVNFITLKEFKAQVYIIINDLMGALNENV